MMRKLLALLPIVAVVVAGNALVASAGIDATPAPEPSTTAYTVMLVDFIIDEDDATTEDTTATGDTAATGDTTAAEPDAGVLQAPDLPGNDVGPLQGDCIAQLATIELTTGAVTPLDAPPSAEACAGDLTFGPDGTLYGLVGTGLDDDAITELVRFDTTTGAATVIGQIGTFNSIAGFSEVPFGGLAFDAQGTLFVELLSFDDFDDPDEACLAGEGLAWCLYRIDDPNTPAATTLIGQTAAGDSEDVLFAVSTLNASCTTMYTGSIIDTVEDERSVVQTVDTGSGAASELGDLRDQHFIAGQATDRAGTLWALEVVNQGVNDDPYVLATLNPAGGDPIDTEVGPVTFPDEETILNGLAIEPLDCAQPEPLVLEPTFTG